MRSLLSLLLAGTLSLGVSACGPLSEPSVVDGHDHEEGDKHGGHHDHGEEAAGARYAEGKGITLLDETKEAIGLEVAEAEERKLAPVVLLEAQVYRTADEPSRPGGEQTGSAYAAAFVNPRLAEKLKGGESSTLKTHDASYEARVWRIDPVSKDAVNSVEAILQIPDPQNILTVGEFVSGSVTQIRRRRNGSYHSALRCAGDRHRQIRIRSKWRFSCCAPLITTGAENADYAEITDGIYAGDVVATNPVETLYLIELRATKGGGHSH